MTVLNSAVGGVLKPGFNFSRTSLDILYVVVVGKLKKIIIKNNRLKP